MKNTILGAAVVLLGAHAAFGQCQVPKEATYIMDSDIKEVLKFAPPAVDQQLRVVDLCKYNLAVGIIHRGPTGAAARAGNAAKGDIAKAAAKTAAPRVSCSSGPAPADAKPSGASGISHDDETETYVIVSGTGTLVTGGVIVNGFRSPPESEVTKVLNGPSCSGQIVGDPVKRVVNPGDVIIIPFGVPHGWTAIADHVDYLSVRPDPDHILPAGYVNTHIAK
jgi:mannose-6-phosphate isomerase-like protein (cupin superfamily)